MEGMTINKIIGTLPREGEMEENIINTKNS